MQALIYSTVNLQIYLDFLLFLSIDNVTIFPFYDYFSNSFLLSIMFNFYYYNLDLKDVSFLQSFDSDSPRPKICKKRYFGSNVVFFSKNWKTWISYFLTLAHATIILHNFVWFKCIIILKEFSLCHNLWFLKSQCCGPFIFQTKNSGQII